MIKDLLRLYGLRVDWRVLHLLMLQNCPTEYGIATTSYVRIFQKWMASMIANGQRKDAQANNDILPVIPLLCGRHVTFQLNHFAMPVTTGPMKFIDDNGEEQVESYYFKRSDEHITKMHAKIDACNGEDTTFRILAAMGNFIGGDEADKICPIDDLLGVHTTNTAYVTKHGHVARNGHNGKPRHFTGHLFTYVGKTRDDNHFFDTNTL